MNINDIDINKSFELGENVKPISYWAIPTFSYWSQVPFVKTPVVSPNIVVLEADRSTDSEDLKIRWA